MSGLDSNPFVDPVDVNPFQDASITQATSRAAAANAGEFNPFSASEMETHTGKTIPLSAASSQPAILQTSVEQSAQANAASGQADLLRQQEELEKKAAELERKERELRNSSSSSSGGAGRTPNAGVHSATLFLNVLACLAYFTASADYGVDFGLSILWFVLFTPMSFVCWYRPVYKAFRSDSSFSFFFFFFVFFFQVAVYIIQTVGIPRWGNSGWIASISMIGSNLPVAVVMMVVAGFFTVNAVLAVILLKMVHSKYRRTGASFSKAQHEFSHGVLTNQTVQTAASSAAASAAQGAFGRSQGN
uniref:Secretory carrier-associated membrane protein n=1 Tax=Gasterosteus aculeatus aculeatus TaxID=481459 RepID=A0AAQ4NYF6_GASAC